MAKAKKRRAGRAGKSKAKRGKRRVKAARSKRRSGTKRKATRQAAGRKKKTVRRKRTTAEGMRRAMRMKQADEHRREEMQQPVTQTPPTPAPAFIEPDRVPHNIREQGDVANIIQNTTNRRAG